MSQDSSATAESVSSAAASPDAPAAFAPPADSSSSSSSSSSSQPVPASSGAAAGAAGGGDGSATPAAAAATAGDSASPLALVTDDGDVLQEHEEDDFNVVSVTPARKSLPAMDTPAPEHVAESTIAAAERNADYTTATLELASEAAASAVSEGAYRRLHKAPTEEGAALASDVGTVIGDAIGTAPSAAIKPAFVAVAKRLGAHDCDGCGAKDMYKYWKCTSCPDYDLCMQCYASKPSSSSSTSSPVAAPGSTHTASHSFVKHDNAIESFKYMVAVVLVLWLLKSLLF